MRDRVGRAVVARASWPGASAYDAPHARRSPALLRPRQGFVRAHAAEWLLEESVAPVPTAEVVAAVPEALPTASIAAPPDALYWLGRIRSEDLFLALRICNQVRLIGSMIYQAIVSIRLRCHAGSFESTSWSAARFRASRPRPPRKAYGVAPAFASFERQYLYGVLRGRPRARPSRRTLGLAR